MEWKTVPGFESYECSYTGKIRRIDTQKEIARTKLNSGYFGCTLHHQGRRWSSTVHRIVAITFISQPPSKTHEVNHINGDKLDNTASNLEWVTHTENQRLKGQVDTGQKALTDQQVFEIVRIRNETGASHAALSEMFDVCKATIGHILTGRTRGYLWPNGKPEINYSGFARNQYTSQFKSADEIKAEKVRKLEQQLEKLKAA
jgi:hypothetical protein